MINFCQFGAGRIGAIHARNIFGHPDARLQIVVDPDGAAAERLAACYGAVVASQVEALADRTINAVVIASSTDTHAGLVEAAARAGRAVFCEKPLDLDRRRAEACVAVARECGVPLMVGFNRRFDPNFARLEREIRAGRIGQPEILRITSYDPAPPTIEFVRRSGGIFRDMMIHDLDMACWLSGEEPVELFATASVMVDPAIGEAGDVDTAVVTLRMKSGALCQIANSRRAAYGYDQRIEVLGSKGGISAENVVESTVVFSGSEGVVSDKPLPFFLQRYAEAYRRELDHFITAVSSGAAPLVGAKEGIRALALADAAVESARIGQAVKL
ncbi:MAG: inositol 2-dehydrogenase [Alphaproteobacteria bacterium]|nr:MAG: inositol 2-dehydrogenase [Alphaproteobacteria bacterium]